MLPDRGPLLSDLQVAGIEVLVRPLGAIRRELASVRGAASIATALARDSAALARLVRRRQIALVHSNTSIVIGGAAAAALARVPHVWHVRELYSRFPRLWPVYRRLLRTARALACISAATAAQFPADDRVSVIPDGLVTNAPKVPREQARAALGLPLDVPVIALVGRISELKGQEVLARALAEPRLEALGAIGLLAGEPWPGAEHRLQRVREVAWALGAQERLRHVGFRDDVETVYGAADLVAVPSTSPEGLGGVAIEAAAAGCAVIAAADGGLTEIIADGSTGRLVAPGDATALARVAAELIEDPAQRERLSRAAELDVRERFAPERLIERIQALYDSVLLGGR